MNNTLFLPNHKLAVAWTAHESLTVFTILLLVEQARFQTWKASGGAEPVKGWAIKADEVKEEDNTPQVTLLSYVPSAPPKSGFAFMIHHVSKIPITRANCLFSRPWQVQNVVSVVIRLSTTNAPKMALGSFAGE